MRNRYSLVYPWTVARIRARSRLFEPESRYWRGFPLAAISASRSVFSTVWYSSLRSTRARRNGKKRTDYVRYATTSGPAACL
jgi:hypothetical protein